MWQFRQRSKHLLSLFKNDNISNLFYENSPLIKPSYGTRIINSSIFRPLGILVDLGVLPEVEEVKEEEVIYAVDRSESGKIICKKERKAGRVPSIVFEGRDGHLGGHKRLISVEAKQIDRLLKKIGRSFFLSKTFAMEIVSKGDGKEIRSRESVIPHAVHQHASTDELLNVTFMRVLPGTFLKVDIPLLYVGEDACPGIRRGGFLNTIKRTVKYICPANEIPTHIEVDLSKLNVGDRVLLRDLPVSPKLRLFQKDSSLPVCKIGGSWSLMEK